MGNDKQFYLGVHRHTCRICDTAGEFKVYAGREMMQGCQEVFRYFICSVCECMQIEEIPENLSKYYGNDYYSYRIPDSANEQNGIVTHQEVILDVGCGSGDWLSSMAKNGYGNLFGCDPFIETDLEYPNGVKIRKAPIHEMDGKFDVIRLANSFEHMHDPLNVLLSVKRLLEKNGYCWIGIPVHPNVAFDEFGVNWYQMDPPRHLFLHSMKSMVFLAKKSGLSIKKIEFDSNGSQFMRSRLYQLDIPYGEQTADKIREYFSPADAARYKAEAEDANRNQVGDHAVFYLTVDDVAENGEETEWRQAVELSDTVIEALEYLIQQAKTGELEKNSFMLHDILQAHRVMRREFLAKT